MNLPTFMCIGAPKAATTWLHACLKPHPEIFMPDYKEMHFFMPFAGEDLYLNRSLDYYRAFYQGSEAYEVRGEVQTHYFASPHAPARIAKVMPNLKLIIMLRDPAERLWSHYHYDMNRAMPDRVRPVTALLHDPMSFRQVHHGFYARNLREYLRFFDRSQIKWVFMEDITTSPEDTIAEMLNFIGATPFVPPETQLKPTNVARVVRSRWLHRVTSYVAGQLAPRGLGRLRRIAKRTGLPTMVKNWNARPMKNPPLGPKERAKLVALYREDIFELEEMVGQDLSRWRETSA